MSCDNSPSTFAEQERTKNTTIELQELAKKDSNVYKVVVIKDTYYIINSKTNLVESRISNHTGSLATMFMLLIFLLIIIFALISFV